MASRKRKRKQAGIHQRLRNHNGEPQKRIKLRDGKSSVPLRHDLPAAHSRIVEGIRHEVLSLYHARLLPLRAYLLSALPAGSKRRRRLLLALGTRSHSLQFGNPSTPSSGDGAPQNSELGYLLDSTLVSMRTQEMPSDTRGRLEELSAFSQKHNDTSLESVDGVRGDQADIVDFAIRQLFDRESGKHASHLLCYGYECAMGGSKEAHGRVGTTTVPGLTSRFPNPSVDNLKGPHWVEILRTLGSEGERVMLNLLLDCSIFCGVGSGHGNYYQLSGMPLPRLKPLADARLSDDLNGPPKPHHVVRSGSITFSRNRMLYATAAFDGVGHVRHGLPLIHVLNKYSDDTNLDHTHHVMKYIFPHQYGLQSVLMPPVNTQQPIKWYKDYTSREQEIAQADRVADLKAKNPATTHGKTSRLPRRLRGKLPDLITKLRKLHALCPYVALLDHFCPIGNQHVVRDEQSIDSATTSANVSAFVRAVISRVVPHELWGTGPEGVENERLIMRSVDRFVVLRRFEGLTLHEVLQGLKINSIAWLRPVRTEALANLSSSDTQKRLEIFSEFVHYLFDSLLIPLIRANFHVTESNIHRNRIFFFRQDLWQSLTRSTMATLTRTMLQAHDGEMSQAKLAHRRLGYSHIRLLPKAVGLRPIMNLSKRAITMRGAKKHLEPSINSTLTPLFNVLNFERKCQPAAMGSSMLSVGDLYSRLSSYREGLQRAGKRRDDFYFVKVDVRSCFDTIPQHRVVELLKGVMSEVEYRIDRHVVVKVAEASAGSTTVRPARRFATVAKAPNDFTPFADSLEDDLAVGRKASVFVGGMPSRFWKQRDLLELLAEHVQANLVKIGKSYYRQKEGIPQGSVLSSLLCNFVYGQLEAEKLQFLREDDSLLLRLIDDFLLITTSREDAGRFLGIMQAGLPDYGVAINPSKTLTNFHGPHDRSESVRLNQGDRFPYCGNFINTRTLEISKDRARKAGGAVSDSLTVEYSNMPGKTFHRKVLKYSTGLLSMFKLQSHAMFLDTSYNSTTTVLANIHQAFIECAMKFHRYIKCLSSRKRPGTVLLSNTIDDLVDLAYVLMKSQRKREKFPSYQCAVTKAEVKWLAATAFQQVLSRKQSVYRDLLARLTSLATAERPKTRKACRRLEKVARASTMAFGPLQY